MVECWLLNCEVNVSKPVAKYIFESLMAIRLENRVEFATSK